MIVMVAQGLRCGDPILVFDLCDHLHFGKPVDSATYTQIVVVRGESGEPFGILVVLSPERIRLKLVKARERGGGTVREFIGNIAAQA